MKKALVLCLLTGLTVFADVEEKNRREEQFTLPAGAKRVIVDNVFGSVTARGVPGNQARIIVNERWRGETASDLARARREVKLDITQQGDTLKLYVDGPFRCKGGNCNDNHRDYNVEFDFELAIPEDSSVELGTVNGGRISVQNVRGDFRLRNVNGAIDFADLGGSGSVQTVNGGINGSFSQAPKGETRFKTVNGGVKIQFPDNLSAQVSTKTLNGSIFTDFEGTMMPTKAEGASREGSRYVYRSRGGANMRIGQGGPDIHFETLNGTIEIAKRGSK
jgi:hypothetical protein